MAVSAFKTFSAGEVLTASDLNGSFSQVFDNGEDLSWPATKAKDLNAQKLILDDDQDTSITADTDDRIDLEVAGADVATLGLSSSHPILTLVDTVDDATAGPFLRLRRNRATTTAGDIIGQVEFSAEDDTGSEVVYAEIQAEADDITNGSTKGQLHFRVQNGGGSFDEIMRLASDFVQIRTDDDGAATNPTIRLWRNSTSPNDADKLGNIEFAGEDSTGDTTVFGEIYGEINDVTEADEDGHVVVACTSAGTLKDVLRVSYDRNVTKGIVTVLGDDAGVGAGPRLALHRDSGSPAPNDVIGEIAFDGEASDSTQTTFGIIDAEIIVATASSEDGGLALSAMQAGTLDEKIGAWGAQPTTKAAGVLAVIDNGVTINGDGDAQENGSTLYVQHNQTTGNGLQVLASNESFEATVVRVQCNRGENAAWDFMDMREDANSANDVEFLFNSTGDADAEGTWNDAGAGFGEYMEWDDGNPSDEDRVGFTVVTLPNGKIRKAEAADEPTDIVGVVSGIPGYMGNAAPLKWSGYHSRDEFGRKIRDDDGKAVVNPAFTPSRAWERHHNDVVPNRSGKDRKKPKNVVLPDESTVPDHGKDGDPVLSVHDGYVKRKNRKEWSAVSFLGQEYVRDSSPTHPGWYKLNKTSANVTRWLVMPCGKRTP